MKSWSSDLLQQLLFHDKLKERNYKKQVQVGILQTLKYVGGIILNKWKLTQQHLSHLQCYMYILIVMKKNFIKDTVRFLIVTTPTTTQHNLNLNTAVGLDTKMTVQTPPSPQKLNRSLQEPQINI